MPNPVTYPTADVPQRLLSVQEYNALIESGELGKDDRVELLEGRIVPMSPSGPSHAETVTRLMERLVRGVEPTRQVRVQCSIELPGASAPEPDLAIVRRRDFGHRHPRPEDILLVIEVSVSAAEKERGYKVQLYARAGITECWVVLPEERVVEVYRRPAGPRYLEVATYEPGATIGPGLAPEAKIRVHDIL